MLVRLRLPGGVEQRPSYRAVLSVVKFFYSVNFILIELQNYDERFVRDFLSDVFVVFGSIFR